jgi:hypothetical protein
MSRTPIPKNFSASALREVILYEPKSGSMRWKETRGRSAIKGAAAGTLRDNDGKPYLVVVLAGRAHSANRLAWYYMNGTWPSTRLKAKDGNLANLAWSNIVPESAAYSDSPMATYQRERRAKIAHARAIRDYADQQRELRESRAYRNKL